MYSAIDMALDKLEKQIKKIMKQAKKDGIVNIGGLLNLLEALAGGDLAEVRARGKLQRRFTLVDQIAADAEVSVVDRVRAGDDAVVQFGVVRLLRSALAAMPRGSQMRLAEAAGMTPEEMTKATLDTVAATELRDAYIRLVVSRGVGDLGIDPNKCPRPTIVIIVGSIALYPEEMYTTGISLITSSVPRMLRPPRASAIRNAPIAPMPAASVGEKVRLSGQKSSAP